jgi:hypothetical protein
MSRLVRLYPRAWRDRYEAEFQALLEERPLTLGDRVDIVRGALDARVHPNLDGTAPTPWTHRLPGLLALAAGLAWSGLYLSVALWPDSGLEWGPFLSLFLLAAVSSLPGDYMAAHGRQIAIGFGAFAAYVALANVAAGTVVGSVSGILAVVIAFCGPLALAASRARVASRGRWLLLGASAFLPLLIGLGINIVRDSTGIPLPASDSFVMFLLVLPYGFAWAFVGIRMAVQGAPTFIDQPPATATPESEVFAA